MPSFLPQDFSFKNVLPLDTTVLTHWMPWWGGSGHIKIGYESADLTTCFRQCQQMKKLGIDGINVDWYGTRNPHHNLASLRMLSECERQGLKFSICVDQGIVSEALQQAESDPNAQVKADAMVAIQKIYEDNLAYVRDTFCISDSYLRINGKPLVNFFGDGAFETLDWSRIRAVFPEALLMFRQRGGFTHKESNGAFAWIAGDGVTGVVKPSDSFKYLEDFYAAAAQNPTKVCMGSVYAGFNNNNPNDDGWSVWDGKKHLKPYHEVPHRNGLTLLDTCLAVPPTVKLVMVNTWNDWEEGSNIEGYLCPWNYPVKGDA